LWHESTQTHWKNVSWAGSGEWWNIGYHKLIQELGTSTSHPTAMIDVEGNQYTPNYEEIQQIIEHVDLSDEFKDATTVLLNILRQIVPSGTTLLYSKPWSALSQPLLTVGWEMVH
jgi:hypothetical protein